MKANDVGSKFEKERGLSGWLALHWRLKDFHIDRSAIDFTDFARTCWFGPLDLTAAPIVDGDLALRGERIDRAPDDVFEIAMSAAQERHQAVNWLFEGPERYSQTCKST